MNNDFVLVSFIGRNSNKYDTVDYLLPENEEKVFTNDTSIALIKAEKQHWNITRAVIIGTYTSNWFELVSESDDKALYDELVEICGKETEENIDRLEDVLGRLVDYFSDHYNVDLKPIVHRSDLSADTIAEIADDYDTHVFDLISGFGNVLIDITHGYRHMPILLFQIFQQHMLQLEDINVELVYGEFDKEQHISIFRNLGKYWDAAKQTDAINRFRTSFDGSGLVPLIKKEEGFGKLANWINRFSLIIKSDYLMQVYSLVQSLPQIMEVFDTTDDIPAWIRQVQEQLEVIYDRLCCYDQPYDIYFEFARLLEEKGLLTQSVIALAAAIETRTAVYQARIDGSDDFAYIGNYHYWADIERGFKGELLASLPEDIRNDYMKFNKRRNLIAHAAGESWWKEPSSEPFRMAKYFKMAEKIFSIIDDKEYKG